MASGSTAWTYDARGRVTGEQRMFIGAAFNTGWEYNSADLPSSMTYPDGEEVTYEYNNRMLLETLSGTSSYVTQTLYDAAGRVISRALGNGLSQAFTYYAWNEKATVDGQLTGQGGRLKLLSAGSLQSLSYLYDATGNIRQIENSIASETQDYEYDVLDRLSEWTLEGIQSTYTYNTAGNLSTKEGFTLTYGDSNHPHAVTASGTNSYGYDANGNMTSRGPTGQQYTLTYDAEGRLVTVSGPSGFSAAFTYDGDGQRVKQVINGVTAYFVGNYYENTGTTITKYYYAGASRIAMRTGSTVYYLLGDHLSSTSITTDSNGALLMETRYKPFGEVRYATTGMTLPTRYTFTGQYSYVSDEATDAAGFGLMYFGARFYDPLIARFVSPDTLCPISDKGGNSIPCTVSFADDGLLLSILNETNQNPNSISETVQTPFNSQSFDRYAFVYNNPIKYTDPSGNCLGPTTPICLALIPAGPAGWVADAIITVLVVGGVMSGVTAIAMAASPGVPTTMEVRGRSGGAASAAKHLAMLMRRENVAGFAPHPGMPDPFGRDKNHNAKGLKADLKQLQGNVNRSGKNLVDYLTDLKWTPEQISGFLDDLSQYINKDLPLDVEKGLVDPRTQQGLRELYKSLIEGLG